MVTPRIPWHISGPITHLPPEQHLWYIFKDALKDVYSFITSPIIYKMS